MPVRKVGRKYAIGRGKAIYKSRAKAEKAMRGMKAGRAKLRKKKK